MMPSKTVFESHGKGETDHFHPARNRVKPGNDRVDPRLNRKKRNIPNGGVLKSTVKTVLPVQNRGLDAQAAFRKPMAEGPGAARRSGGRLRAADRGGRRPR